MNDAAQELPSYIRCTVSASGLSSRSVTRKSGKNILFSVTNDGTPIGKKEIKKIWDPFYKTDKARTGRLGSSGVGLAVNKSILEQHKAKYGCRSDESGTTFWFEMRKAEEDGQ